MSPDGTIKILQDVLPERAFIKIGMKPEKKTIIVEDDVAKAVIEHILKHSEYAGLIDVKTSPNGEDSMKRVSVLASALFHDDKNTLYIFDGDQFRVPSKDPDTIPPSDNNNLAKIIKEQTVCEIPSLHPQDNEDEKIKNQRKYLKFYYEYVCYFPTNDPEEIIWKNMSDEEKQGICCKDVKDCFVELAKKWFGEDKDTSEYILKIEEYFLYNRVNPTEDKDCQDILEKIKNFYNKN